ncbi:hypothetical protein D3C72_1463630 [compost metagenome]
MQLRIAVLAHQGRADLCRGIVQAQFIGAVALVLLAFDRVQDVVARQFIRRQVGGAERSPDDYWLVWIAICELHDDFLSDAGDRHVPPQSPGPVLRDADPAGAVFIVATQPVPGKLHLDAAPGVAIDLFIGRADHGGHLWAVEAWFGGRLGLPVDFVGHEFGGVVVARALFGTRRVFFLTRVLHAMVAHAHGAPALVPVFARVAGQVEGDTGNQTRVIAFDKRHARIAAAA